MQTDATSANIAGSNTVMLGVIGHCWVVHVQTNATTSNIVGDQLEKRCILLDSSSEFFHNLFKLIIDIS